MGDTKRQVQGILERMPDECSFEDVRYELYVAERIRRRLAESDGPSQIISHTEVEDRSEKWCIDANK